MAARVSAPRAEGSSIDSAPPDAEANSDHPRTASPISPRRRGVGGTGLTFVAATEQLDSGPSIVRVMGEVDLATVKELERALLEARKSRTSAVIVELTGCTFLDSRGLRALSETRQRLERASRRLALVLSNPSVLRIFQITALDQAFEIYPSLGAALDCDGVRTLEDKVG